MINSSAAREAILARIRGFHSVAVEAAGHYAEIARTYQRAGRLDEQQRIALFEERLREYDAQVRRVTRDALAQTVGLAIRDRGAQRLLVPDDLPASWLPSDIAFRQAGHLSHHELDGFDGIVSGCTVAIALTGTIVLQNAPAQGPRRLSLIPDFHLCVVFADQLVETVSEAFDRLAETSTLPTTFISGPSATADIEMTRIKGVHGPRFLTVVLVC